MKTQILPETALAQHIAVLGKTGAGKTSTAKLIIEQVVDDGARVCILDPIKSDWWGLTSSANGKKGGLPFQILGGPHGHVPLSADAGSAVGNLVASGQIPLSIIDMADFGPGGQSKFFVDFAAPLLRHMRGVVYLVIEEAHEFAPKERSGIGAESLAIHWAKKLATAGRSKGIRLILSTQRTQSLHNALLGSCDTLIAHRFTTPADQAPIINWLKANVPADVAKEVAASLSSLKTGEGWICSGEAKVFERRQFPRISTYDNTSTPTHDSKQHTVTTAPIDLEKLTTILGEAVIEAKSNDPKVLRAQIADLTKQLAAAEKRTAGISEVEVQRRINDAVKKAEEAIETLITMDSATEAALRRIVRNVMDIGADAAKVLQSHSAEIPARRESLDITAHQHRGKIKVGDTITGMPHGKKGVVVSVSTDIPAPHQRILDVLAQLHDFGIAEPNKAMLAAHAGVSPTSGGYFNNLGKLRSANLIDYPTAGCVALTASGRNKANPPEENLTLSNLQASWYAIVTTPQANILRQLVDVYPNALDKRELAELLNVSPTNGGYFNNLGKLRTLGAIDYPSKGYVAATELLFPKRNDQ